MKKHIDCKSVLLAVSLDKHKWAIWGYCLLLSFFFLLICTKSSPLYPFNDWVDANAFFTMGKGMMNGKVLYRDLFEQKGPLLYFLHGVAYLISNTSFFGVFLFEVFSFSVFLYYSHKLISLFLDIRYSIIGLPLITAIILNMKNFYYGDSAEEFCLPFITISLYCLIKYLIYSHPDPIEYRYCLLNGIIAGCVLCIKFTLLGFWFGWMACVFFVMMRNRYYGKAVKACCIFLLGMLIAVTPWIIYFGINNSILEWVDAYLLVNVKAYPISMTLLQRIIMICHDIGYYTVKDTAFGLFCFLAVFGFVISKQLIWSSFHRIGFAFCAVFLALGVYGGGRSYVYYFFIFSPYVIFGFITLLNFIDVKAGKSISRSITITISAFAIAVPLLLTLFFNNNRYMLEVDKGELAQYRFASVINRSENATLLNYGFLDMGFYTTTGITPNIRFFEKQNLNYKDYPLNMDEQNRYIEEKVTEFVVLRQLTSETPKMLKIPYLYTNYTLIAQHEQEMEGKMYRLLLFKRKE